MNKGDFVAVERILDVLDRDFDLEDDERVSQELRSAYALLRSRYLLDRRYCAHRPRLSSIDGRPREVRSPRRSFRGMRICLDCGRVYFPTHRNELDPEYWKLATD